MNNSSTIQRFVSRMAIEKAVSAYVNEILFSVKKEDVIIFLHEFKRGKIRIGQHEISLLEATNKIITDLTILYTAKDLINKLIPILTS